jgi:hypothetical protein
MRSKNLWLGWSRSTHHIPQKFLDRHRITNLKTAPKDSLRKAYLSTQYNKLRRAGFGNVEARLFSRSQAPQAIAAAAKQRRQYILEMAMRKSGSLSAEGLPGDQEERDEDAPSLRYQRLGALLRVVRNACGPD